MSRKTADVRIPPTEVGGVRVAVPGPPSEFLYTLLYRIGMSFIALVFSAIPIMIWGALNGWRLTQTMIVVQALITIATIATGESLRSSAYARRKERHDDFARRMAVEALIEISRAKSADHGASKSNPGEALSKRALDVVLATTLLIILAPTLFLIALLIKLDSAGPVLYMQVQLGVRGRPFKLYRFRWFPMHGRFSRLHRITRFDGGEIFKATPVGRLLMATALAELPALINVLRGEMSLVGPRPVREVDRTLLNDYPERFLARPGLTGPWVLWTAAKEQLSQYLASEVDYVRHWSLSLDFRILARALATALLYRH